MSGKSCFYESGHRIQETLSRRKALFLSSIGIAGAFLNRTTAAGLAVADPSTGQAGTTSSAGGLAKRVTVNGLGIEYEVIGKGEPAVITPGGRFSKETPGVRELAEALARGGKQVLMVLRSGKSDLSHPRKTSEEVHALIRGATIAEPPWPDNEWLSRQDAARKGEGLFQNWPRLAPQILDFARRA